MVRSPGGCALLSLLLLLSSPLVVRAAEPRPESKVAQPTDWDYAVQGEYVGEVLTPTGSAPLGVQVVALGQGKFKAVSYAGGLPGDGWDRSPRQSSEAETKGGVIDFNNPAGFSGTLNRGVLTVRSGGVMVGRLLTIDRKSPTLGTSPPEGALVLFDGSTAGNFEGGKMTEDGLLLPGCTSKEKFGGGKLHVEFRLPLQPEARDQERGDSGVYLQGRYEVQVLDSFGLDESDTGCGAIYSLKAPDQNMCYPPGEWQTYDIDFRGAEYQNGKPVKDPIITVKQNGVLIDRRTPLSHATPGAPVAVGEEPGPICLQDHGSPVRYRNIWFVKTAADGNK